MRYGKVTAEDVARMARRADKCGEQLDLAAVLFNLAGAMLGGLRLNRLGLPFRDDWLKAGLDIDLSADGRKTKSEPPDGPAERTTSHEPR